MARHSIASTTDVARVRHYFGLGQRELGQYLGVSAAMVGHLEAGRKLLSGRVLRRLAVLATQVPAAPAPAPPLPPPAAPPAPGPLAARLDWCRWQAGLLRPRLARLQTRATYAHRWQQALPALLAAAAAVAPLVQEPPAPADWLRQQAQPPDAEFAADWHLLHARLAALEAEAAALAALLPPAP
ncbi:helix-turn-helix domain-containing protein [Hymenobacter rubripertinctus]|uniref:helix-turn-helix domain-containing protein n=1 Tax=Hymenobacter rubripertinctus TaxID=2029981 RepID=UPI00363F1BE8